MPKLFIALDFPDFDGSMSIINKLKDYKGIGYKVGLQLFLADGEKIMKYLAGYNVPVFLDLKFNDIPNTVKGALKSIKKYGPYMVNMHISAGINAIRYAKEEISTWDIKPLLIGVTVLTSLMKDDLQGLGLGGFESIESLVIKMSRAGWENGLDGVVTSNHEVKKIKSVISKDLITVVPGIKVHSAGADQKRVAGIDDAIESKADYIVIGRAITASSDPCGTLESIMPKIDLF